MCVSGLHQPAADCISHKAGSFVDIKFLHKSRSMGLRRFYADPQKRGDVLC